MNVTMPLSISTGSGHSAGEQYGCDCALKDETKLPKYKILREKGASDPSLIPKIHHTLVVLLTPAKW